MKLEDFIVIRASNTKCMTKIIIAVNHKIPFEMNLIKIVLTFYIKFIQAYFDILLLGQTIQDLFYSNTFRTKPDLFQIQIGEMPQRLLG
ncbi:hypothetical protein D3C75_610710 [compost metagenome]